MVGGCKRDVISLFRDRISVLFLVVNDIFSSPASTSQDRSSTGIFYRDRFCKIFYTSSRKHACISHFEVQYVTVFASAESQFSVTHVQASKVQVNLKQKSQKKIVCFYRLIWSEYTRGRCVVFTVIDRVEEEEQSLTRRMSGISHMD